MCENPTAVVTPIVAFVLSATASVNRTVTVLDATPLPAGSTTVPRSTASPSQEIAGSTTARAAADVSTDSPKYSAASTNAKTPASYDSASPKSVDPGRIVMVALTVTFSPTVSTALPSLKFVGVVATPVSWIEKLTNGRCDAKGKPSSPLVSREYGRAQNTSRDELNAASASRLPLTSEPAGMLSSTSKLTVALNVPLLRGKYPTTNDTSFVVFEILTSTDESATDEFATTLEMLKYSPASNPTHVSKADAPDS